MLELESLSESSNLDDFLTFSLSSSQSTFDNITSYTDDDYQDDSLGDNNDYEMMLMDDLNTTSISSNVVNDIILTRSKYEQIVKDKTDPIGRYAYLFL
jgi:hypothetical protein